MDASCPELRNKPKLVLFQACCRDWCLLRKVSTDGTPNSSLNRTVTQVQFSQLMYVLKLSCKLLARGLWLQERWQLGQHFNPESQQNGQAAKFTSHLRVAFLFPVIVAENDNQIMSISIGTTFSTASKIVQSYAVHSTRFPSNYQEYILSSKMTKTYTYLIREV